MNLLTELAAELPPVALQRLVSLFERPLLEAAGTGVCPPAVSQQAPKLYSAIALSNPRSTVRISGGDGPHSRARRLGGRRAGERGEGWASPLAPLCPLVGSSEGH